MRELDLVKRKVPGKDEWEVIWDSEVVYSRTGKDAEFYVGAFVDGLERGLVGSKKPLLANSQVRIRGVYYGEPDEIW